MTPYPDIFSNECTKCGAFIIKWTMVQLCCSTNEHSALLCCIFIQHGYWFYCPTVIHLPVVDLWSCMADHLSCVYDTVVCAGACCVCYRGCVVFMFSSTAKLNCPPGGGRNELKLKVERNRLWRASRPAMGWQLLAQSLKNKSLNNSID